MDDVLIDAPFVITQEMVSSLRIDVVVKGSFDAYGTAPAAVTHKDGDEAQQEQCGAQPEEEDMYALPRRLKMLQTVPSSTDFSVLDFVDRIQDQRDKFATK